MDDQTDYSSLDWDNLPSTAPSAPASNAASSAPTNAADASPTAAPSNTSLASTSAPAASTSTPIDYSSLNWDSLPSTPPVIDDRSVSKLMVQANKKIAQGVPESDVDAWLSTQMAQAGSTSKPRASNNASTTDYSSLDWNSLPTRPPKTATLDTDQTAAQLGYQPAPNYTPVPDSPMAPAPTPGIVDMNATALRITGLGAKQKALDDALAQVRTPEDFAQYVDSSAGEEANYSPTPVPDADTFKAIRSSIAAKRDANLSDLQSALSDQQQQQQALKQEKDAGGLGASLKYYAKQGAGNAAPLIAGSAISVAQPELAPIALPAIFGAQAYAQKYGEARGAGADEDTAHAQALASGGINAATAVVPGGAIAARFSSPLVKAGTVAAANELAGTIATPAGMAADEAITGNHYTPDQYLNATVEAAKTNALPSAVFGAVGARDTRSPAESAQARASRLADELGVDSSSVTEGLNLTPDETNAIQSGVRAAQRTSSVVAAKHPIDRPAETAQADSQSSPDTSTDVASSGAKADQPAITDTATGNDNSTLPATSPDVGVNVSNTPASSPAPKTLRPSEVRDARIDELSNTDNPTPAQTDELNHLLIADRDQARVSHTQAPIEGVVNDRARQRMLANNEIPTSRMLVDLDNFKNINDEKGYPVGDEAIRQFGETLAQHHPNGLVTHLGGDEFVLHGNPDDMQTAIDTTRADLSQRDIIAYDKNGQELGRTTGLQLSRGLGHDDTSAEAALKADKTDRRQQGLRTARTEPVAGGLGEDSASAGQTGSASGVRSAQTQDVNSGPIAEPIRNGRQVLYRGDVDAMRQSLQKAGMSSGLPYAENGKHVGLYFPAAKKYQVDSVLNPLAEGSPAYRRSEHPSPAPAGLSASEARNALDDAFGALGSAKVSRKVALISRDDLARYTPDLNDEQRAGVKGFTSADKSVAALVHDNITQEELPGLAVHEIWHANSDRVLSPEQRAGLAASVDKMAARNPQLRDALNEIPSTTPDAHVPEEKVAYALEHLQDQPIGRRVLDQVKLGLNRVGVPLTWLNGHEAALREIGQQNLRHFAETNGRDAYLSGDGANRYHRAADDLSADGSASTSHYARTENVTASVSANSSTPKPEQGSELPRGPLDKVFDHASRLVPDLSTFVDAIQKEVAPMATGSVEARATAKDFANAIRRARWDGIHTDEGIAKQFTRGQQEKMWRAADAESVARQRGHTDEEDGLASLTPAERASVEGLQSRAQAVFNQARALGMVKGQALPSYTPRMLVRMSEEGIKPLIEPAPSTDAVGRNLRTSTPQLNRREHLTTEGTETAARAVYGDDVTVAKNIRALPLATSKLEQAIAGRALINRIQEIGQQSGAETVREGKAPDDGQRWFTVDHPAFYTWRPRLERALDDEGNNIHRSVMDAAGLPVFDKVPLYVRGDFEGPIKAVLSKESGPLYNAAMALKGKVMSAVMYSPLIHNAVEWGRALPAMPGKVASFRIYFEGNAARNDPGQMRDAIDAGLVPIGHRGAFQDISSIQQSGDVAPGRSWTAKLLAAIPGLFDKRAGDAVKRSVDAMGDFWHNTLLWDRVADLQMGLYTNMRDRLTQKGFQPETAQRLAAHLANRYAGALPQESMSKAAQQFANLTLFSRTFTLGNLGAMKDMLGGIPRDIQSQILRDAGPQELSHARAFGRRKAIAIVSMDIGLNYLSNSLLQSAASIVRGINWQQDLDDMGGLVRDVKDAAVKELSGYATRFQQMLQNVHEDPWSLLHPFDRISSLTPMSENEPGKQDRVLVGHAADGTGIYMRNPVGKIGEEFVGWATSPLDMLRRKKGTFARPLSEILSNDKGFGRKVYDPYAKTWGDTAKNAGRIVQTILGDQLPTNAIQAAKNYYDGVGDKSVNAAQVLGPLLGMTFSKGAPGGPAVGVMYAAKDRHEYQVSEAMPQIRALIQRGDMDGARTAMDNVGMTKGYQKWVIATTFDPSLRMSTRQMTDFNQYASPEEQQAMESAR